MADDFSTVPLQQHFNPTHSQNLVSSDAQDPYPYKSFEILEVRNGCAIRVYFNYGDYSYHMLTVLLEYTAKFSH